MLIDILFGSTIAFLLHLVFQTENLLFLILFGIFSSLAPDIDFFIWAWKHHWRIDKYAHEHRDLFHHPFWFILGGVFIFSFFLSGAYILVWVLGALFHFIHDTFDGGWGIRWLSWPLPKKLRQQYFTYAKYSPKKIIKNKEEQRHIAKKDGNDHWLFP